MSQTEDNTKMIKEDMHSLNEGLEQYGKASIRKVVSSYLDQEISVTTYDYLSKGLIALLGGGGRFLINVLTRGSIHKEIKELKTDDNEPVVGFASELAAIYHSRVLRALAMSVKGSRGLRSWNCRAVTENGEESQDLVELKLSRLDEERFSGLIQPEEAKLLASQLNRLIEEKFPYVDEKIKEHLSSIDGDETSVSPKGTNHGVNSDNQLGFKLDGLK